MVNFDVKPHYGYEDLLRLIHILRSPEGCPWDRVQTHHSLRRCFLEEACEAVEAIDRDDPESLREELGDVLLQVVFHADLASDAGDFTMDDVCDRIVKQMIYRHPHVFGSEAAEDVSRGPAAWDDLKRREKGQTTHAQELDAVARTLPQLWRAEKLQKKAAAAGFDWPDISGALSKLDEEVAELRQSVAEENNISEELGDVLFAAVKVGRFAGIDPEAALSDTCEKFIRRFRLVEEAAAQRGTTMEDLSVEELEKLWQDAKKA